MYVQVISLPVHMYVRMYVYVDIYLCMHVSIYVSMKIETYEYIYACITPLYIHMYLLYVVCTHGHMSWDKVDEHNL